MSNPLLLPAAHPLRAATWIWPEAYMYLYNHFAQFRRDFDLAAVPARAPLFLTADKGYKLYVNGHYAGRGPARGYQQHWPYDEVDLAPWLRPGHNWLAIEAYNPGISTFQYLHQTRAGFLAAAQWGDFQLLTEPQSWQMRRAPGQRQDTARLSMQLDFQEHLDLELADRAWITSPQAPSDWPARPFDHRGQYISRIPFGQLPYADLEARGIPPLRETRRAPARLVSQAAGRSRRGYRDCANVAWHWLQEARRLKTWDAPAVPTRGDGHHLCLELPTTGRGGFLALTIDPGEYLVANLVVEADGAAGGETLDFLYGETLVGNRADQRQAGDGCLIALANRLRLRQGANGHEFFHLLGFGVLTVVARDLTQPLRLRLGLRQAGYPFAMTGQFACSDPVLEQIHAACRRTQQICALDAYVDTPWREQAQWWGDARVQARNTFYLDGDARLLARGIRSIAGQGTPMGLTYGHAPTCSDWCILPDFSVTWLLTLRDYYWQTGDLDLFREQWPRAQQVLAYFDTPEVRDSRGLLRHDCRFWYFGDWSTLYKGDTPTFLNLWYLHALREIVTLLRLAGLSAEHSRWAARAADFERLVMQYLYDPAARLFRNGLDAAGQPAPGASVHDQTLAILLGLAPEAHEHMLQSRLLPYVRDENLGEAAKPSAFWSTYVFDVLGQRGHAALALAFIKRHWQPMLATGTTWEGFDWSENSGGSASHAWTAHPCSHFVNLLVGLTQQSAAWRQVAFQPCCLPGIARARALVPTPHGPLEAAWERHGDAIRARLSLPAGVTVETRVDGNPRRQTGGVLELTWPA